MPLSAAGYTIQTEDETFEELVSTFENETNTTVDRNRTDDQIVAAMCKVFANVLRKRDEERLAIYNAGSINNATGLRLEDLVSIVGVEPKGATYTTDGAAVPTGTFGTVIPAGALVEYNDNRFRVLENVGIGGGNTVKLQALQAGAINLPTGTGMTIVTPIAGWDTITSSATKVAIGRARETDQELRIRRSQSLSAAGAGSTASIQAGLLSLDYVTAAVVLANQSSASATVQGITMNGNSLAIFIWPAPSGMTSERQEEIGETIWRRSPAATEYDPPSEDVTVTVTDSGGGVQTVKFDDAVTDPITVTIKVYLAAGYNLSDVSTQVDTDITAYFNRLTVGQPVYIMELYSVMDAIEGVTGADFTLDGTPDSNYVPNVTNLVTISGTITIT
ncbi:MAG: baseplate J/gp47 family protein [Gemmatimonadota bacterium]|nr:MAG: baseplate J/gp47 family protein [Gemmatimonadota bacterium]